MNYRITIKTKSNKVVFTNIEKQPDPRLTNSGEFLLQKLYFFNKHFELDVPELCQVMFDSKLYEAEITYLGASHGLQAIVKMKIIKNIYIDISFT